MSAEKARKVFYCGVNWERGVDRAGRAQGLLDILQAHGAADFYGPSKLEGMSPWEGFKSYRGEIPFDGVSMVQVMRDYGAVLAVSSPAHMKSRTSSSRVFEGIGAGVPVISDENPHVQSLFGDLVYYFRGETEAERAQSILSILEHINANPGEAFERVVAAQRKMREVLCFEPCLQAVLAVAKRVPPSAVTASEQQQLDVFVFHHDPDPDPTQPDAAWSNLSHIARAAGHAAAAKGVRVRVVCCSNAAAPEGLALGVTWQSLPEPASPVAWRRLRLGEKVALLASRTEGRYAAFLTQFDFPHHDHLSKALDWFDARGAAAVNEGAVYVGGFFVNDLEHSAPLGTVGIIRNNASLSLYRWTQNSLAEHQLASLVFCGAALDLLVQDRVGRFDAVLPVSIVADALGRAMPLHRSRHITVRVEQGSFHRHYEAYRKATERGFWAQHYEMVSNYSHELNALYDVHHEFPIAREIADQVSGHALPPVPPVDPAVHAVNQVIGRIRPIYRTVKKARDVILFKGGPQGVR
jgi:hypothetical protein